MEILEHVLSLDFRIREPTNAFTSQHAPTLLVMIVISMSFACTSGSGPKPLTLNP